MHHQGQLVAAAADGHRTFLLADEPGLGKTAQALLAAQAADAWPLLVVVPNVVKMNWAREVGLWTPEKSVTVIHGDGETSTVRRHLRRQLRDPRPPRRVARQPRHARHGRRRGALHQEQVLAAPQHVLHLADRIRSRFGRPLLMALTGTPLINDIEDFQAIWEFLRLDRREASAGRPHGRPGGHRPHPGGPDFYPNARRAVVDMGIVRRRKIDVAADIPARRIADLPVELDDEAGRSIREAERELARRLVERYEMALATRKEGRTVEGIDHELVRRVATWEREDMDTSTGENVFSMMRRIGKAKAGCRRTTRPSWPAASARSSSSPNTSR